MSTSMEEIPIAEENTDADADAIADEQKETLTPDKSEPILKGSEDRRKTFIQKKSRSSLEWLVDLSKRFVQDKAQNEIMRIRKMSEQTANMEVRKFRLPNLRQGSVTDQGGSQGFGYEVSGNEASTTSSPTLMP